MNRCSVWIGMAAVLLLAGDCRAQGTGDLAAIIDKAIVAAGGKEKLGRLKAQTWQSKMTIHNGKEQAEVEATYAVEWPDKIRSEIRDGYTLVRNGDQAWMKQDETIEELNSDRLLFLQEDMYVNWVRTLAPLRDKGFRYQSVPPIEVEGKPVVGVRVSHKGHRDVVLLFDKTTYLIVKVESKSRGLGEEGDLANIESYFYDYRDVAGTKVPTRVKIVRDGELFMEIESRKIERREKLDDELFARPE